MMLSKISFILVNYVFLLRFCLVTSDFQNYMRCGWLYGSVCPTTAGAYSYPSQPLCIDRNLCKTPPFNPVCGQALPPCLASLNTVSNNLVSLPTAVKPLPTLPPLNNTHPKKTDDHGYALGSPLIGKPLERGSAVAAMPSRRAPEIINAPLSSITVKEKDVLRLICSVTPSPLTRVTWSREKDNAVIGEGEMLVIGNISQSDAGEYFCKAQNKDNAAAAMVRTKIHVQCPPRIPSGSGHTVVTATSGERITLICETNCTPEPYFIWYRDKDFKNPLKTCDAPGPRTRQNLDAQNRSFCDLTLAAIPGDKLTCLKTNTLGQEKQTFEIKPKIIPKNQAIQLSARTDPCLNYKAVGCYTRCSSPPDLPELLFTDTGQTDQPGDSLAKYTNQLVCRCARAAESRGFVYFGISSYDQCYSGDQTAKMFDRSGPSDRCINEQLMQCTSNDTICIGKCCSIYVYEFKDSKRAIRGERRTIYQRGFKRPQCSTLKQFLEKLLM